MYVCILCVRMYACACVCVSLLFLGSSCREMLKGMPIILALRIASHTYFEFATDVIMCCVPRYLFSSCSIRCQAAHGILCLSRHSVLHAASLQCVINCRRVVVRTECFNYTIPRRSQFNLHKWTVWIPSHWFGSDVCLHLAWQCIIISFPSTVKLQRQLIVCQLGRQHEHLRLRILWLLLSKKKPSWLAETLKDLAIWILSYCRFKPIYKLKPCQYHLAALTGIETPTKVTCAKNIL